MNAPPIPKWIAPSLLAFTLSLGAAPALAQQHEPAGTDPLSESLVPDPGLSPGDVIGIQVEALRNNDQQNRGIAVAFRFASPANRVNTGPLSRFIAMIEQGPYALMLDFHHADYGPVEAVDDQARQRVTLTGARASTTYWFFLSRQSEAPYVDCWMTDAVYIEPSPGRVT